MSPLEIMRERRAAKKAELDELLALPTTEKRDLNSDEDAKFESLVEEIRKQDDRIAELEQQEKRESAAAEARAASGDTGRQVARVQEPPVYTADGLTGNSFFRDLAAARLGGDDMAADRLRRNTAMVAEQRALGNTGAVGGSGGEFAPPVWLVDEYIALVRAGRVTADLFNQQTIPAGVSSVNLPKVLTGTTVAPQTTQNTAGSQTDMTTGYVQTGFATLIGKQVVSQQLIDQSAIPFDKVILGDLASAYAQQVGTQVLNGTGAGSGTGAVVNGLASATFGSTTTWTQAAPTVAGFYGQASKALAAFQTARFVPPTAWLMHPRRWYWLVSQVDSSNRPLVVPQGNAFNAIATLESTPAQGLAGIFLGLPVYIDPNISITGGAGSNQDNVYLLRQDDLWFFESEPQPEVFREPYSDSAGVLFRMMGYVGTILNRYTASLGVITGTGLVTPVWAS